MDPDTGRPRTADDPCWGRGVTMGFHFSAAQEATTTVKAFLRTSFRLGSGQADVPIGFRVRLSR